MYTSPGISDVACALIMLTKTTLKMTCYCFDSEAGVAVVGTLLRRGVQVSIVVDSNQTDNPSCVKQHAALLGLMTQSGTRDGALTVKRYCPTTGFASYMHVKSWFLDDLVYVGGSYNFAMNAEKNNEEHLVVMKEEAVCRAHSDWFSRIWHSPKAEVLTSSILALQGQRAARSKSVSRPR